VKVYESQSECGKGFRESRSNGELMFIVRGFGDDELCIGVDH
jgi:hypothetical protein